MPHFVTLTLTSDRATELRRFLIRLSMRVRINPPEGWGDVADRLSASYNAIHWTIKDGLDELPKAERQAGKTFDVRLLSEEIALIRYAATFYGRDFGLPPKGEFEDYPDTELQFNKLFASSAKVQTCCVAAELVKEVNAYG